MQPSSNFLVSSLSQPCREALLPHLENVALRHGSTLFTRRAPASHAWFVESGMISAVARVDAEDHAEIGIIGREGLAGLSVVLGSPRMAMTGVVQQQGSALRISAPDLQRTMEAQPELSAVLLRYAERFLIQVAQTAACNVRHDIEQRLARWLLTCQDRTDSDELQLTHDFLAWMLGVRRAGVTTTIHILEGEQAIRATRGLVTIRDRAKLEQMACSCNRVIEELSDFSDAGNGGSKPPRISMS